jgi:hypothetical protein
MGCQSCGESAHFAKTSTTKGTKVHEGKALLKEKHYLKEDLLGIWCPSHCQREPIPGSVPIAANCRSLTS